MKAQRKSKPSESPTVSPAPATPPELVAASSNGIAVVHNGHDRVANGTKRHRHQRKAKPPEVSEDDHAVITKIDRMLTRQVSEGWEVGDLTSTLVDRPVKPVRLGAIGSVVGSRHKSTISRCHRAAITVRNPEDRAKLSIYEAYDIYRAHEDILGLGLSRDEMVQMFVNRESEKLRRNVRAFFLDWARQQRAQQQVRLLAERSGGVIGSKVFFGEWENVLTPAIAPATVDLIVADPPFGHYKRIASGGYSARDGGNRHACVNNDKEGALRTTTAMFKWGAEVLKEKGRLILLQAGTQPLRCQIQEAAARFGYETDDELHWMKELVSPRDHDGSHGSGTTKIVVYRRKNAQLNDYTIGGLSNADVLFCPSVAQRFTHRLRSGDIDAGDGHKFQTTIALMEYLLLIHCPAGGLVVEPFGCTGSASLAAIRRGFDFRYCEAAEENFNEGSNRIHRALEGDQTIYSEDLPENLRQYVFPPSVANVIELLKRFDSRANVPSTQMPAEVGA